MNTWINTYIVLIYYNLFDLSKGMIELTVQIWGCEICGRTDIG